MRLTFIDAKTSRVISRRFVMASATFTATTESSARAIPWNALTTEQKSEGIQRLIRETVAEGVPALLAAPAQDRESVPMTPAK